MFFPYVEEAIVSHSLLICLRILFFSLLHLAIANGNENIALRFIALSSLESINAQNYIGQVCIFYDVVVGLANQDISVERV